MYSRPVILLFWFILLSQQVSAELKPFGTTSLKEIQNRYRDQPFLLALWSLDCPPCFQELEMLSRWIEQHPGQNLVLISTDQPGLADQAWRVLEKYKLHKVDNWIASDSIVERFRYHIDPRWHGELPRSYFYSAGHERRAHSGTLSEQMVNHWIQLNGARSP
jgi:thiol-disulfide isomerase/thioredoxin